jgi:hypothetical protein
LAATEALGVGGVAAANEPIVAYVSDVRTGEISIFTGETEIVLHDRALVAKLAHAKGGK